MTGSILAVFGAAVLIVFGARWLLLMRRVRIPADVRAFLAASAVAALSGVAAFVLGVGLAGGIAAAVNVAGGLAFLALYAGSGQRRRRRRWRSALRCSISPRRRCGPAFDLARLHGPVLLKFFAALVSVLCRECAAGGMRRELTRAASRSSPFAPIPPRQSVAAERSTVSTP